MAKSSKDKGASDRGGERSSPGDALDVSADGATFEEMLQELEETVRKLEQGNLGLQESLEAYQLGISRLKLCHKLLSDAELKIEMLSGVDEDGNPIVKEVEVGELSLEEKQAARSRRRSAE
jgi:exodeoxyribonuclease VII small subunit